MSEQAHACTIVARNYLAFARVLASSFLDQHSGGRFTVLVLDDEDGSVGEGERFEVVRPDDIMAPEEFATATAMYDILELATAVKPRLLRALLGGSPAVAYLDPDIRLYAPIDEVFDLAREHTIVLTPHTVAPVPRDGRTPDELYLLRAGVYNLGFIAVSRDAEGFLDWWWERLRTDCVVDPDAGLFVDQRWIDLVPSYFDHVILRDPGYNVAYWNLGIRRLERDGDGLGVAGHPLKFFHFSGFDPDRADRLSKHHGAHPRFVMANDPITRGLCAEYAEELRSAGHDELRSLPVALGELPNGVRLDKRMRRIYRDAVVAAETAGAGRPPDPHAAPDEFLAWLREPVAASGVSRYLARLHDERVDLQKAFGDIRDDAGRYLAWVVETGVHEESIPPQLLDPEPSTEPEDRSRLGVEIAGYFRAEMGVGEAGRRFVDALEAVGVPHSTMTYDQTAVRQRHAFADRRAAGRFPTAIVCVNADETPRFAADAGDAFFRDRYVIGVWAWEVDVFPERWSDAFDYVDEVWAGSRHTAEAISAISPVPVLSVPLPIEVPEQVDEVPKSRLGWDDAYTFFFAFDFLSVFERKNPLAVVWAFETAFPEPREDVRLVLKSVNAEKFPGSAQRLRDAVDRRPEVAWVDGYVDASEQRAMMAACDCYVSLHRAEGFGLTMAEAMARGKPVVATGYSGNLDFMTPETAFLVPYRLREVGPGNDPYPAEATWADPDVDAAADAMRRLAEDPSLGWEVGRRARRHIDEEHSSLRRGERILARLGRIAEKGMPGPSSVEDAPPPPPAAVREITSRIDAITVRGDRPASLGAPAQWMRKQTERLLYPMLKDVKSVLHELTARMAELESSREERIDEALRPLWEQLEILRSVRSELEALRPVRAELETLRHVTASNDEFKVDASRHLASITDDLRRLDESLSRTRAVIDAAPYVSDAASFEVVDEPLLGERALAYTRPAGAGGEAERDFYRVFEDVFRGSRAFIKSRLSFYMPLLRAHQPVIDVGCGRGELLELLREEGIEALGVDLDEGMVEYCRSAGLPAVHADARDVLEDDERRGTIGAVFAAHVIEHIPPGEVPDFFRLAYRSLRPGGVLVAETVNPRAMAALKTFWVDLTHVHPIFPEVALVTARAAGFARSEIVLPEFEQDASRKLPFEERLSGQGEYAVVARK